MKLIILFLLSIFLFLSMSIYCKYSYSEHRCVDGEVVQNIPCMKGTTVLLVNGTVNMITPSQDFTLYNIAFKGGTALRFWENSNKLQIAELYAETIIDNIVCKLNINGWPFIHAHFDKYGKFTYCYPPYQYQYQEDNILPYPDEDLQTDQVKHHRKWYE